MCIRTCIYTRNTFYIYILYSLPRAGFYLVSCGDFFDLPSVPIIFVGIVVPLAYIYATSGACARGHNVFGGSLLRSTDLLRAFTGAAIYAHGHLKYIDIRHEVVL